METAEAEILELPSIGKHDSDEQQLHQQIRPYLQPRFLDSVFAVAITWILVFLTFDVCVAVQQPLITVPIALFVLGACQHRCFTIYHDAMHGCLFQNQALNLFCGKWLSAYPALICYENARKRHLTHHRFASTERDPERTSHIRSVRALIPLYFPWPWIVAGVLHKVGILKQAISLPDVPGRGEWNSAEHTTSKEVFTVLALQAAMLVGFVYMFHWYGLLYHAALVLTNPLLTIIRQWVEHYDGDQEGQRDSRYVVITPTLIERFLFAPMNFNLHAAHHKFPSVPFSCLPEVQKLMDKTYPDLIRRKGYLALIMKELPW